MTVAFRRAHLSQFRLTLTLISTHVYQFQTSGKMWQTQRGQPKYQILIWVALVFLPWLSRAYTPSHMKRMSPCGFIVSCPQFLKRKLNHNSNMGSMGKPVRGLLLSCLGQGCMDIINSKSPPFLYYCVHQLNKKCRFCLQSFMVKHCFFWSAADSGGWF